jgi:hypothetical protein
LAKPNARNFLAISSLSANRSTDFSGGLPGSACLVDGKLLAKTRALTKLAAMAEAASAQELRQSSPCNVLASGPEAASRKHQTEMWWRLLSLGLSRPFMWR